MALFRVVMQTDVNEEAADADLATAAEDARAAAATELGEVVHGRIEYDVNGISPHLLTPNRDDFKALVAVVASGTLVAGGVGEADIVTGSETLILTLSNGEWSPDVGEDTAITQDLIDGLVSAGSDGGGWNALVVPSLDHGDVVRTSDTVVTITLPALSGYWILDDETITVTVPASAVQETSDVVATPTIPITDAAESAAFSGTMVSGGVLESEIVTGGETLIVTLTNQQWNAGIGDDNSITSDLIDALSGDDAGGNGFEDEVTANMDFGDVDRTSDTVVTFTLPAAASYSIASDEDVTLTIPAAATRENSALAVTGSVTITEGS